MDPALNFPDPNVTTTYTNPDTGITYEWSNNTWKAVRNAQTAPELFVDYDGDNMTGDLTFNTDKIVLGATFGTGTFAGNIEIGGDVGSPTAGGVEITSTGTVIANRIGNPNPTSYADCFVGRYNGVDTSEIKDLMDLPRLMVFLREIKELLLINWRKNGIGTYSS